MRSSRLGIITNNQHNVFQSNIILGAREIAQQRGYTVEVDSYAEDDHAPGQITLDYTEMAGVLVIANAAPLDLLQAIYASGVPLSLVSHKTPGLPIPAVVTENVQGIAALVSHLVNDCQRRKLVFIRGVLDQCDSIEREEAFRREQMRYHLSVPAEHFVRGDFSMEVAAQSIRDLVEAGADFDAVIAADYLMGIAAVKTLREYGIRVPEDVSVVGFGDAPIAEAAGLTTVAADVAEQGRRAARQLISQIEGVHITGVTVLNVQLLVRATCGCRHLLPG